MARKVGSQFVKRGGAEFFSCAPALPWLGAVADSCNHTGLICVFKVSCDGMLRLSSEAFPCGVGERCISRRRRAATCFKNFLSRVHTDLQNQYPVCLRGLKLFLILESETSYTALFLRCSPLIDFCYTNNLRCAGINCRGTINEKILCSFHVNCSARRN